MMSLSTETMRIGAILPEIILSVTILVVLVLDAFTESRESGPLVWVAALGALVAGLAAATLPTDGSRWFYDLVIADGLRRYLVMALSLAGILGILMSRTYLDDFVLPAGEYLILLLSSLLGMFVLVSTTHLGLLFLGLELTSLPLYTLTAYNHRDVRSGEGGIKYFLLGSAAGGLFLLGTALVYGETGTLDAFEAFARIPLSDGGVGQQLGLLMLLTAVGFKLAWVPFHPWSPDAYEGAPAPVTAFMSTAVKVAVIGAAARLLVEVVDLTEAFRAGLWWLAAATMIVGNLMAVVQSNLKRLLAYSSIAHAGYLAMAFYAGTSQAVAAAAFYVVVYVLMNMGAFGVIVALSDGKRELESVSDLRGLSRRHGWTAFLLLLFMMSLSGIPPLAGFAAKLFLFQAAVEAGAVDLVIIGVLTSVVGAYYYLRPVIEMYLHEGEAQAGERQEPVGLVQAVLVLLAIALLVVGLVPSLLLESARAAVVLFGTGG